MKRIIMFLAAAIAVLGCSEGAAGEQTLLSIQVENLTAREVVLVYHGQMKSVALDESGAAQMDLSGYDALYAKLYYGRNFKSVYFEKGDEVTVTFNGTDFQNTFSFEGEKAPAVEYLNRVRLTALPDEEYALPFNEFYAKTVAKENDAVALLEANVLEGVGNFLHMEKGRIRYAYGATLLMHSVGHKMMTRDIYYIPSNEYYDVLESYLVEDEAWVDLEEYRAFIVEAAHMLDAANRQVTDLYPKTVAQMKYLAGRFKSEKVRNTLLHYLAATYVDRHGIDNIQDMENIYFTYVKDEVLLADYKAKFDKWDLSRPGKPSPEISAVDIDGKQWTLADFRGKYIYIDMWATWCAPCRREMPYLKALEEKFKDAQIVFLGLSTDSDKSKWETMVKEGQLTGVQLYLGPQSAFQKAYQIDGIPRFILLDKEGKIIDNNMSRPSQDATAAALEALDGIR
jgi:thiol-disulfide isomerase/thioredoxin